MLSERVLDELVRRSALSEELCKALWPDLLVESKLQLLAALQADLSPSTPDWLVDLALEDKSPVVQYFALRHAYLRTKRTDIAESVRSFFVVSDEDVARHARAHAVEHPLVRAAVADFSSIGSKEYLRRFSQLERLVAVRNEGMFSLGSLVEFLEEAVDKMDDRELAAVAHEYFLRPDAKRELQRGRLDYADGESAYYAGDGMKKGWQVVRKAGPVLANVLVSNLPTSLGLATIEAKELATMPERVLELLVHDSLERKEVADLHRMMRDEPSHVPPKVIEALERASDFGRYDPEEIQRERRLASPLSERVTLEVVLELQKQVAALSAQLQEMRDNPPKRGFFG
ncbi:hypothetical protein RAMLITH_22050 [Ramlibacter sp. RBP-2]|uniref:Uncharacterized protein n=1 Tax=Ramlibacter lithotrophicus TaxID=2606681 RepID=A0A7X6DJV2_9BURK|nr:hypothetical protein [Ramlibacter lithotrophicus]NKE68506.1 hypothetical protein [Ramlibacter lithotrophicus]